MFVSNPFACVLRHRAWVIEPLSSGIGHVTRVMWPVTLALPYRQCIDVPDPRTSARWRGLSGTHWLVTGTHSVVSGTHLALSGTHQKHYYHIYQTLNKNVYHVYHVYHVIPSYCVYMYCFLSFLMLFTQ